MLSSSNIVLVTNIYSTPMNRPQLEIAAFNAQSALSASRCGAGRIELCTDPEVGGCTPNIRCLQEVKAGVSIPVRVMIRPRGGSFVYTEGEFSTMKEQMVGLSCLADGFVFGVLTAEKRVDFQRNAELVQLAGGKPCTFHRAFDELGEKMVEELETIRRCGFDAVLTSGGEHDAASGMEPLAHLVKESRKREGFSVIVGGGVRHSNIGQLVNATQAGWFHSSAIISGSDGADELEIRSMVNALSESVPDTSTASIEQS
jgi:copper homeostasis protein